MARGASFSVALVVFFLGASFSSSSAASETCDVFGIKPLYASNSSSAEDSWFGNWSVSRTLTRAGMYDPNDDRCKMKGSGEITFQGGECFMKGNPRLYVESKSFGWESVEFTAYGRWVADGRVQSYSGLTLIARTNHGDYSNGCSAPGYYARIYRTSGESSIQKEYFHNSSTVVYSSSKRVQIPEFEDGLANVWVGMKFVVITTQNGDVLLELYYDLTGGRSGGDWTLINSFTDTTGAWEATNDVPDHCPVASGDVVLGSRTYCFLRTDGADQVLWANASIRHVTSEKVDNWHNCGPDRQKVENEPGILFVEGVKGFRYVITSEDSALCAGTVMGSGTEESSSPIKKVDTTSNDYGLYVKVFSIAEGGCMASHYQALNLSDCALSEVKELDENGNHVSISQTIEIQADISGKRRHVLKQDDGGSSESTILADDNIVALTTALVKLLNYANGGGHTNSDISFSCLQEEPNSQATSVNLTVCYQAQGVLASEAEQLMASLDTSIRDGLLDILLMQTGASAFSHTHSHLSLVHQIGCSDETVVPVCADTLLPAQCHKIATGMKMMTMVIMSMKMMTMVTMTTTTDPSFGS
eukprot:gene16264-19299_t